MKKMRMVLALAAALAAASLATPISAQASLEFWTDEEGVETTITTPTAVDIHGELAFTFGSFRVGPCLVTTKGSVAGTTAELTQFQVVPPCGTNVPGCAINTLFSGGQFPWTAHLSTEDEIAITGFSLGATFNDGCTALGIPPGVGFTWSGTLTGTTAENACIAFNEAGDLKLGEIAANTDGELCITDAAGGGAITIK